MPFWFVSLLNSFVEIIPNMNVNRAKETCVYNDDINNPPKTNPLIILLFDSFKTIQILFLKGSNISFLKKFRNLKNLYLL